METLEKLLGLFQEYGFLMLFFVGVVSIIILKRNEIFSMFKASILVEEYKRKLDELKSELEKNTAIIAMLSEENKKNAIKIATLETRLEKYEELISKKTARSNKRPAA